MFGFVTFFYFDRKYSIFVYFVYKNGKYDNLLFNLRYDVHEIIYRTYLEQNKGIYKTNMYFCKFMYKDAN